MRPEMLRLQGFGAYRSMDEPIVFEGADLFALTGATGAGKSSLIDAMCFALYGRIPRLAANAVEPVISLGASEARIDFAFSVDGTAYRAVRVVRRTKTGATTPEARLEGGSEVISGAAEVTREVERLLGLGFDEFTRCVVLPQGEFAAFLNGGAKDRQDLLKTLLDLERFDKMRQLAEARKAAAETEAAVLERGIAATSDSGEENESAIRAGIELLAGAAATVDVMLAELETIKRDQVEVAAQRARLESQLERLRSVVAPPEIEGLGEQRSAIAKAILQGETILGEAVEAVEKIESELAGPASLSEIDAELEAHRRLAEAVERIATGESLLAAEEAALAVAGAAVDRSTVELEVARSRLRDQENRHRAHAIRTSISVGDACPVCFREISELPEVEVPADLGAVEREVAQALSASEQAKAALNEIDRKLAGLRVNLVTLHERRSESENQIRVSREELTTRREGVVSTKTAFDAARGEERRAREELERLHREERALTTLEDRFRDGLGTARDSLSEMGPPAVDARDLGGSWQTLSGWIATKRSDLADGIADVGLRFDDLVHRHRQIEEDLGAVAAGVDIVVEPAGVRDAIIAAYSAARIRLEQIVETRVKLDADSRRAGEKRAAAVVAGGVAGALRANGFEAWLLQEALDGLVAGANQSLERLADGAYSLALKDRDFVVIDHRNADERRSVRTLSGGETFLVSLALALALAERIATLAPAGTARLESMFLDEGFGTLDAETLDSVASVLHELSAGDRMVGIVTHVKELAEQMPVRFMVSNVGGAATVERVET